MKFLQKYMPFFEADRTDTAEAKNRAKQVAELYEKLTNERTKVGVAMSAIVALHDTYDKKDYRAFKAEDTDSGSEKVHPSGAFSVYYTKKKGFRISFKENYTPMDCFIYITPKEDGDYICFIETSEQTATFMGRKNETEEEKTAREEAKGFFRYLNKDDSKNQFAKEKPKKNETPTERQERLDRNREIEKARKVAYDTGNYKSVSNVKGDYEVSSEFDNLADCLEWAWAYFVARKTPRILDKIKTFDYLIANFDSLKRKKIPLGTRYGIEDEDETEGTIIEELKKVPGLLSMFGEEQKNMRKTANFIINLYKVLGLVITPIKGTFDSTSVSKGAVRIEDANIRDKETVARPDWIIGIEISNQLSNPNTVLGAACKTLTGNDNSSVTYTNANLVFELSQRDEFKKIQGGNKIMTGVENNKIMIYFSRLTKESVFKALITGDKHANNTSYLQQAFSGEIQLPGGSEVATVNRDLEVGKIGNQGQVESVKADWILDLITEYTKNISNNIKQFISNFKKESLKGTFEIPEIDPYDPRILKILADTIGKSLIGKSLSIKKALEEENPMLFIKLFPEKINKIIKDLDDAESEYDDVESEYETSPVSEIPSITPETPVILPSEKQISTRRRPS